MNVDDDVVEEVGIDDRRTRIKVQTLKVDEYLKRTVLVNLDQMEDCSPPLRDVSADHVARLLLLFQRNSLDTRMGPIAVRMNPLNHKGHGPKTDICKKGKPLPVL